MNQKYTPKFASSGKPSLVGNLSLIGKTSFPGRQSAIRASLAAPSLSGRPSTAPGIVGQSNKRIPTFTKILHVKDTRNLKENHHHIIKKISDYILNGEREPNFQFSKNMLTNSADFKLIFEHIMRGLDDQYECGKLEEELLLNVFVTCYKEKITNPEKSDYTNELEVYKNSLKSDLNLDETSYNNLRAQRANDDLAVKELEKKIEKNKELMDKLKADIEVLETDLKNLKEYLSKCLTSSSRKDEQIAELERVLENYQAELSKLLKENEIKDIIYENKFPDDFNELSHLIVEIRKLMHLHLEKKQKELTGYETKIADENLKIQELQNKKSEKELEYKLKMDKYKCYVQTETNKVDQANKEVNWFLEQNELVGKQLEIIRQKIQVLENQIMDCTHLINKHSSDFEKMLLELKVAYYEKFSIYTCQIQAIITDRNTLMEIGKRTYEENEKTLKEIRQKRPSKS